MNAVRSAARRAKELPVPVGYSNSNVPMVKPTEDWQGQHASYRLGVAPAGSNRSSRGGNEAAEAFDGRGHVGDPASSQADSSGFGAWEVFIQVRRETGKE